MDCRNMGIHGGNKVIYDVNIRLAGGQMGLHGGNMGCSVVTEVFIVVLGSEW